MKALFNPYTIATAAAAVGLAAFGRWEYAALAGVAFLASLAMQGLRFGKRLRSENAVDQVSNENRARILPIAKLAREIEELVAAHPSVASLVGSQVIQDSSDLLQNSIRQLNRRSQLQKVALSDGDEIVRRSELELEAALQPGNPAVSAKWEASEEIKQIDGQLQEVEAVLSDLKLKLQQLVAGSNSVEADSMSDSLVRARAMSQSMEEIKDFIHE